MSELASESTTQSELASESTTQNEFATESTTQRPARAGAERTEELA